MRRRKTWCFGVFTQRNDQLLWRRCGCWMPRLSSLSFAQWRNPAVSYNSS